MALHILSWKLLLDIHVKMSSRASRLLWCQQPPDQSPGAMGSAHYHGLWIKPAVCIWLHQGARRGAGGCGPGSQGVIRVHGCIQILVDVFLHQSKLHMGGFWSLKEGEAVEFTFKKSAKGLESIRVTGPGGVFCIGSERRPKGKNMQKRRSKGDRYGLEGSLCGLGGDMLRVRGTFPVLPLSWTKLPEIKRSLWPLATSGCRRCREGST